MEKKVSFETFIFSEVDVPADRLEELVFDPHACERWTHVREYMSVSSQQTELEEVTQWLQLGNRLTQEGRSTPTYNSSSHVLRVDSTAAIRHAATREEVHVVVVSEPFLFFPGGGTMEGDEGRWRRREKELFLFILFKRCRKTRKTHQSKNSFSVGPLLWWKYCTQVQFWGTYTVHFYI